MFVENQTGFVLDNEIENKIQEQTLYSYALNGIKK